jgi:hypothetical protein
MDALEAVLCWVLEGCSKVEQHPGQSTRGLAG